jgi:hypothetical protein
MEIRNQNDYLQRAFGPEWKGSLTFSAGCANGEPNTVLLALLDEALDRSQALNEGMEQAAKYGHESIVHFSKNFDVDEGDHEDLCKQFENLKI